MRLLRSISMTGIAAGSAVILCAGLFGTPASAAPDPSPGPSLAEASRGDSRGAEPLPLSATEHGAGQRSTSPELVCVPLAEAGTEGCMSLAPNVSDPGQAATLGSRGEISVAALQPIPDWCIDSFNQGRFVTRTQDCEAFGVNIQKTRTTNGVTTVIGTANAVAISFQYSAFSIPVVAHQFEFSTTSTAGDVSGLSLGATSWCGGSCLHTTPGSIPAQSLTPGLWFDDESFTEPPTTTVGSLYYLSSGWTLTLYGGGAPQPLRGPDFDLRCDNAAGGSSPAAGCAVYYAPGEITYGSGSNPDLVAHISQAHASGLPGGSIYDPIHRTTVQSVITANRATSCTGAPAVVGFTCDEYPFASSYEGAASGGTARSFPGCFFSDPAGIGPVGFSRCMIPASQNSSGGAILGNTYRQQRILDADPFFVTLT